MEQIPEFLAHRNLLLEQPPIGMLVQAQEALLEAGPTYDDLASELAEYLRKFHHSETCPHCGAQLYLSDLPQYGAVCYACQENFY